MHATCLGLGALIGVAALGVHPIEARAAAPVEQQAAQGKSEASVGRKGPVYELGIRGQTLLLINQFGLDFGVRPKPHVQLGFLVGRTSVIPPSPHCAEYCRDAGIAWWWVSPYLELRLLPESTVTPYVRAAVGIAQGNYSIWNDGPEGTALMGRIEGGLQFQAVPKGIAIRLFGGVDGVTGYDAAVPGVGLQLGLTF